MLDYIRFITNLKQDLLVPISHSKTMKKLPHMAGLCSLMILFCINASCKKADDNFNEPVEQRTDTLTIAQLRDFGSLPLPSRIYITDARKQGLFNLDQGDRKTADNLGVTLVTSHGIRYKREYTGPANALWFDVLPSDDDIGPELQNAVNGADDVFIPDGSYRQRTTVRLRSNMKLQANPGKVLITLPATYVSLANAIDPKIDLNNVVIDGLSWNVTTRENGTFGTIYIDSPNVANLTIQNCTSKDYDSKDSTNWLTLKIPAGKSAENIVVKNNVVRARRMGCEIFNHDNYNKYVGKNIEVSNNTFYDCHFGISLSGPMENITVENNTVKNCSLYGIEIAGALRNVKINSNKFEGKFDKFFIGSNDGNGNGSVTGGMTITGNETIGRCTGGIALYNGGTFAFANNKFNMTGMIEISHSSNGGSFNDNTIESMSSKVIICDNTSNNRFTNNSISNRNASANQAMFMAYGNKSLNHVLTSNRFTKGPGGKYMEGADGGTYKASDNQDESGRIVQ
ncbi:hypothetical protein C5O19_22045 [Siphonobacter curvatus]|uniref:Right handed beta helix domain-containing protein n=2 Tax=Siphonobacter curvatus TaxID=2094562 RepID=A0A2S7IGL8_9BACT|nr:hypothetical protein C5O19_22045 [Siphonobacter curvatus]